MFAFEPTATAEMLRANLRHNKVGNAEIHEVALAATTGEREDRIYRLWGTDGEVKTWPFSSLDDFIARHRIERVDCLKIDVDSFDFEVLRGAERTLAERDPVIVVELNHALARRNQGVGEALAWLARRGYRKALVLDNDNFMLQRDAGSIVHPGAASQPGTGLSAAAPLRRNLAALGGPTARRRPSSARSTCRRASLSPRRESRRLRPAPDLHA